MAQIRKPTDVEYLAFQGGGGKGFAYIGAIEAFERLGVLPKKGGVGGTIRGLSGSSAGAIMAFLLTMGCTSKELLDIFKSNDEFLRFFDAPRSGEVRAIRSGDWQAKKVVREAWSIKELANARTYVTAVAKVLEEAYASADALYSRLGSASTRLQGSMFFAVWLALTPAGRSMTDIKALVKQYPFLGPILKDTSAYASNILYDRGIFPGFAVREFLRSIARRILVKHPKWNKNFGDPAEISFAALKRLTSIDLVVVGTNLTQRKSVYFSAALTPEFSVVEAVGISSCFPIMFKPVWIDSHPKDAVLGELRGYWIDGGFLNNIPIHAFDGPPPKTKAANAVPLLNPRVIGLSLVPGSPGPIAEPAPAEDDPLVNFALDMYETAFTPSGVGQFRTADEAHQIISIFSYSLSLFDFAPSDAAGSTPRKAAFDKVLDYFS